jgi:IS5 family transposase
MSSHSPLAEGPGRTSATRAQIAVDQGTDLIRGVVLTGADVGDSLAADALIQGDEAAVYADKAYDSRAVARPSPKPACRCGDAPPAPAPPARLAEVDERGTHPDPLPGRAAVGLMKRSYGYRRVRYRGLDRNRAQVLLMCMAINLRRADRLIAG